MFASRASRPVYKIISVALDINIQVFQTLKALIQQKWYGTSLSE